MMRVMLVSCLVVVEQQQRHTSVPSVLLGSDTSTQTRLFATWLALKMKETSCSVSWVFGSSQQDCRGSFSVYAAVCC
jgi:hypothetical protein